MTPKHQVALEYIIYKLAILSNEELTEISLGDRLRHFNRSNNFSLKKVDLLPFLVTIGNGKKHELLEFFQDDFIPVDIGFVHSEIHEFLFSNPQNTESEILSFDIYNLKFRETFIDNIDRNPSSENNFFVKNLILTISKSNNPELIKIFNSIESSIDFIVKNKLPDFAKLSFDLLSDWSRSNFVFDTYHDIYMNSDQVSRATLKEYLKVAFREYQFELSPVSQAE